MNNYYWDLPFMRKLKIFISSVQSEFEQERQILYDFLIQDALLGKYFEPFIFENIPASEQNAVDIYLDNVSCCDIYLGLFGKKYGFEDESKLSATEHEYNKASTLSKTRLIFLSKHTDEEREDKELDLIRKAEQEVVRKKFSDISELKTAVYSALVRYLEDKEYIRTGPFDASTCLNAKLSDIDSDKVERFVRTAKLKRSFPLPQGTPTKDVLTHLNLLNSDNISNAAILLFGKAPQRFLISSEIKCAQFHGNKIVKPIPSYQIYKGDVFELVDRAVDFVLSRIDLQTGSREKGVEVTTEYEIPQAAISEAIVNAVAHRDYTSNGSVQVMLFKNRLEILNPGELPSNLSLKQLRIPHSSIPANPLLANPMYFKGYIERLGTGTGDIIRLCNDKGLQEPEFRQEDMFKTILWRISQVPAQVPAQVNNNIYQLICVVPGEMKRSEIQTALNQKHDETFRTQYWIPAMNEGVIEMTKPDSPNHPDQRYRLTKKGEEMKKRGLSKNI